MKKSLISSKNPVLAQFGLWRPNQIRFILGLANGFGGRITWGADPIETPRGLKTPVHVQNEVQQLQSLYPDLEIEWEIENKTEETRFLLHAQIHPIPPSHPNFPLELNGLCWLWVQDQPTKEPAVLLKRFRTEISSETNETLSTWLERWENWREQERVVAQAQGLTALRTSDGSLTLYRADLDETYHSQHGSLRESQYVFIQMGLLASLAQKPQVRILEVGLGTALNASLTAQFAQSHPEFQIHYTALETLPVPTELWPHLIQSQTAELAPLQQACLACPWESFQQIVGGMQLFKHNKALQELSEDLGPFDLIYFDAFAPNKQPELWEQAIFELLARVAAPRARLVSYCSQSAFRRALASAGWDVQVLPGPPGKREMTSAILS